MPPAIRLLAIDVDGTLLDSRHTLPAANRDALVAATRRGVEVLLVTGRRFSFVEPIAAQIPAPLTLLASNGAVIKSSAGVTLSRQLLPRDHARAVLADLGAHRENALLLFDRPGQGQIVSEQLSLAHEPVAGYFERNREFFLQVNSLEEALRDDDPIQILFVGAVEPLRSLLQKLRAAPSAALVSLALTEYPARDLTLLDVMARGCNKGSAVARWAAERGLRRDEVMAIGDNWNDREMLEFAGLPVLMANSCDELKASGWAVTASNDDNGVAVAIERFLLGKPASC